MATVDLRQFSRKMRRSAEGMRQVSDQVLRSAVRLTAMQVVPATPADTGKARSNWHISIGKPLDREPFDAYRPFAKYSQAEGQQTAEFPNANFALQWIFSELEGRKFGDVVYLQMIVPYAAKLDNGYSPQAPKGYVGDGIDKAVRMLEAIDFRLPD